MRNLSFNLLHTSHGKENSKLPILIESRYTSRYLQKNAGFSLVEILAVVMMLGILAAIALPSWSAFVNQQRVNKANEDVLAALQDAQRQAKKQKRTYSVSFKNDGDVPKFLIYQGTSIPSSSKFKPLGEDIAFGPKQVLLYTNLDSTTANKKASTTVDYTKQGSGTITFDYMGTLPDISLGTAGGSSDKLGFIIAVAVPNPGTSTSASNLRRCVIVDTLIGGMRTDKDDKCK